MICVYSLRAAKKPLASFPFGWTQLEKLSRQGRVESFQVLHSEAVSRLEKSGDLFHEMLSLQQRLPYL
jgi:DNA primase